MTYINCENCPNNGALNPVDGTPICDHCENRFHQENGKESEDD